MSLKSYYILSYYSYVLEKLLHFALKCNQILRDISEISEPKAYTFLRHILTKKLLKRIDEKKTI